jgi:hypothetical protein
LGGYELTHTPTAPGAGEVLVDAAVALLRAEGATHRVTRCAGIDGMRDE